VRALIDNGLVEPSRLATYFDEFEQALYRFPAIDPVGFRTRVELALA